MYEFASIIKKGLIDLPRVIAWVGVTIRDKVSMKKKISTSEILAANCTLFVDDWAAPLLVSEDKIILVSDMLREEIQML